MMVVEAVAQYVRCGEGSANQWVADLLVEAEERGDILPTPRYTELWPDGRIIGEWSTGSLPVVLFTFRFGIARHPTNGLHHPEALALADSLAQAIVGESDVQVLGLKAVAEKDPDVGPEPEGWPAGTRVDDDGQLGTIVEWQGSSIVRMEYDDGSRSIGRVKPWLRRVPPIRLVNAAESSRNEARRW